MKRYSVRGVRCVAGIRILALVSVALSGCSAQPRNPSDESRFLQSQVIPAMIQWGRSDAEVFPLNKYLAERGFEQVCALPDYVLNSIVEEEVLPITNYHGTIGDIVPESTIAIVAIKQDDAHLSYIKRSDIDVFGHKATQGIRRCSSANKAVLTRVRISPNATSQAMLGEAR